MPELDRTTRSAPRRARLAVVAVIALGLTAAGCGGGEAVGEAARVASKTSATKNLVKYTAPPTTVISGCATSDSC